jgi:hypothetical protein
MARADDKYLIPGVTPPDTLCTTCGEPKEMPCLTCKGECGAMWKHVHDDWMTVYVGNCFQLVTAGGNSVEPPDFSLDLATENIELRLRVEELEEACDGYRNLLVPGSRPK